MNTIHDIKRDYDPDILKNVESAGCKSQQTLFFNSLESTNVLPESLE